jgi:SWI/SNF-related matrix-associated actin-dependent regulator 1 of chromatin subfamily A
MEIRQYQKDGANFLAKTKHALLADEMGLGKTIQAIEAINILNASSVLIICPASVKINWKRELYTWHHKIDLEVFIVDSNDNFKIPLKVDVIIINYDLLLNEEVFKQLEERKFEVLICDEAHYLKNMHAKRTKKVLGINGIAKNCINKMMLTGTPVLNRPIELFILLKTLCPKALGIHQTYEQFAMRYNGAYVDKFGHIQLGNPTRLDELRVSLRPFMLRRTIADVRKQLPDIDCQIIEFPINDKIKKVIDYENELNIKKDNINASMGDLSTLRHYTALAKIDLCIEYIIKMLEKHQKLVLFAYHRDIIDMLSSTFHNYGVSIIKGGMTIDTKQKALDDFIKYSGTRLFIGQIQAAGVGVDGLQKVCNNVIFVEFSWVPGDLKQAIGRLKRIGQKEKTVFIKFLTTQGTIDASMINSVMKKEKSILELMKQENKKGGTEDESMFNNRNKSSVANNSSRNSN